MPLYEYQCVKCGKRVEEMQGVGDKPLSVCPACPGMLKKMVSSCSVSTELQGKELYEREIRPEAKKIAAKIRGGDENATADIFGEDMAASDVFKP
jgi:putative FmdB family regulatory protein